VASSLQAPVLFTIAEDLKKMQLHTSVAEGDVGRLEPGMDAWFTVDAFPGQRFKGKISSIRNAAQTVQNVVTYSAIIDIDNDDLKLRPGMTATTTIVYAERHDVLAIPNAAVRFKPPPEVASAITSGPTPVATLSVTSAGKEIATGLASSARPPMRRGPPGDPLERTVYVLRDGRPEPVTIKTGLTDGTLSEVISGLSDGDQVILEANVAGKSSPSAGGLPPRMGRMF
jgi:HlyD family secretion protein